MEKYKIIIKNPFHMPWMMNRIPFLPTKLFAKNQLLRRCVPLNSDRVLASCCSFFRLLFLSHALSLSRSLSLSFSRRFLVAFSFNSLESRPKSFQKHTHAASCNSKLSDFLLIWRMVNSICTKCFVSTCRIDNYIFSTCFTTWRCCSIHVSCAAPDATRLN